VKKTMLALIVGVATVVAIGGYLFTQREKGVPVVRPASAEALFQTSFIDMDGKRQAMAQWRGKVMVVNFWATWCPPCRTEIPEFVKMQEKYRQNGLIFVGIAIDQKDKVQSFADETGINYPSLLGDLEGVEISRKSGNRLGGLPFTLVIDRQGKIVATEVGELNRTKLEALVKPLL
jgi:thiol-disulfide isomerase/thioredoxin